MKSKTYMQFATFTLLGAIFAYHYSMQTDGFVAILLGCLCGLSAALTIQFTVAAAARRVTELER